MKLKFAIFYPLICALLLPVYAEESASDATVVEVEKELPEFSEPPYTVGDRAIFQGYYIPLQDGISLNFRILNNRMFLYWVDEDDLIVEPQAQAGNVRFIAAVRGDNYYAMQPLQGEDGLGSVGGPVLNPHLFTVILNLQKENSDAYETYTFRYTLAMDDIRDTRELIVEEDNDKKSEYLIDY